MIKNLVLIYLKDLGSALFLPYVCWPTSDKLLSLSEPWFPHLPAGAMTLARPLGHLET